MKAPRFWYQKKGARAVLLAPLGHIYRTAGLLRRAVSTPYPAKVPVICAGNIVAGGAGKTPTCLALKKLINKHRPDIKIGFVSRGYGGSEKGPLRVDPKIHSAHQVGDEALLLARAAPCWVARSRALAIQEAEKGVDLIIMDDGLQNPKVQADLNLLVVDGAVGFGNKKLIPAGPLRETLNDAFSRIDAIIMIGEDKTNATACLGKPVLRAKILPGFSAAFLNAPKVLAFAGIGRPQKFYDSCREAGLSVMRTHDFPDHYFYSEADLGHLVDDAQRDKLKLITTTKDMVRIPMSFHDKIGTLDIELVFEDETELVNHILPLLARKEKAL